MSIRKGTTTIAGNVLLDNTPTLNSTRGVTSGGVYNIPHIIATYESGASGYRIWSDGYCEQWGVITTLTGGQYAIQSVNLFKTFKDSNYIAFATAKSSAGHTSLTTSISSASTDKILKIYKNWESGQQIEWIAKGYLATEQY